MNYITDLSTLLSPLSINHTSINADTGTTGHYISAGDIHHLSNLQPTSEGISVQMPNGTFIKSTHTGELNIPNLPAGAKFAHVFPDLKTGSLLSIGNLCDYGLKAIYDKDTVKIYKDDQLLITGTRSPSSKLWMINFNNIPNTEILDLIPRFSASPAVRLTNQSAIVAFFHAVLGSPSVSTMIKAAEKGFLPFPGLTAEMIKTHRPSSIATAQGHLDQERQGQRPTDHADTDLEEQEEDLFPKVDTTFLKDKKVVTKTFSLSKPTGQNFTDTTSKMPFPSKHGNQYILIMYCHDANYIHAETLHNKSGPEFLKAYRRGTEFFQKTGFKPIYERMDNETSQSLQNYFQENNITIQYVPPHMHRTNHAERAIRTFKNHFISTINTTDTDFPAYIWDELLPQAEITLNLLRASRVNPYISAYQQLMGPYDFNKSPMAPPGIKVLVHEKPGQRPSWASHGKLGFYVGPALQHYRCYTIWVKETKATRISDTIAWFPEKIALPGPSPVDMLTAAIDELTFAIKTAVNSHPHSLNQNKPVPALVTRLIDDLQLLHTFFPNTVTEKPALPHIQRVPEEATIQRVPVSENNRILQPPPGLPLPPPPQLTIPISTRHETVTRSGRISKTPERFISTVSQSDEAKIMLDKINHAPSSYNAAMRSEDKALWEKANSEEFIRLIETSQCMKFVRNSEKPKDRKASYYNPQVKLKIKEGKLAYRVRGTIGGDLIDYPEDKSARTAALSTVKLLLNAVASEDAHWITADVKDFYLGTPLPRKEYMRISIKHIPLDIREKYNLQKIPENETVLAEISKGIYGLPQAGKLAQDRLIKQLLEHGYYQCPNTPCLFKHKDRNIVFVLVVDDFGIKYKNKEDCDHLLDILRNLYELTVDTTGNKYIGITIQHDKQKRQVTLSMPNYVQKALIRFNATDLPGANSPLRYIPPKYGTKQQSPTVDETAIISAERKKRIQEIVGTFLYYSRAVDPTMITAINKIGSAQAKPTEAVEEAVLRFLNYAKRWPNAQLVYKASDMQLICHSDASYLSETQSRSRAGGILFLGSDTKTENTSINGAVEHISSMIDVVVGSAAEAEYAALYANGLVAEGLRTTLTDLNYPQKSTPIICDNACAVAIANNTVKQKRSKAIDMRFNWIRDRVKQGHFSVTWRPGSENLADYFTKAHTVKHHLALRILYVTDPPTAVIRQCSRARYIARRQFTVFQDKPP